MTHATYHEPSPLAHPPPPPFPYVRAPVQRFGVVVPDLMDAPTPEHYFAPTQQRTRYGKTGRLLKRAKSIHVPGARPGTVAFLDWRPIRSDAVYIEFFVVRPAQRRRGWGRTLLDAFYRQVIASAGVDELHWGVIVSAGSHQLYRRMRDLHPQIHHRVSSVFYQHRRVMRLYHGTPNLARVLKAGVIRPSDKPEPLPDLTATLAAYRKLLAG